MEPTIEINGTKLTEAQAMTIRATVEAFADDLAEPGWLGNDAHGFEMNALYRARIDEIRELIFKIN